MRRYRKVTAKTGEVLVKYGRDDSGDVDLTYAYSNRLGRAACSAIANALESAKLVNGKTLMQTLVDAGFDKTTFILSMREATPFKQETK